MSALRLETRELTVRYGEKVAVNAVSLQLPERTVPEAVTQGEVLLAGRNMLGRDVVVELRRRVGMVFQKSNPFPKSVFENAARSPASALDPIATAKLEDLIHELKARYSIVIVTHNLQQAARVSDVTAFFYLGELVEVGPTAALFTTPRQKRTEDYVTGKFG